MFRGGLPLSMRWQDVTLGVGKLAENVLRYIRRHRLLKAGDRVGAAVSGGIDSVALLRLLLDLRQEIGLVLSVVHFNHNLRGAASEADEQFVAQLAQNHELELHSGRGDVAQHAETQHQSTEAAARQLRYQYFRSLMEQARLKCVATGHTLDDQAETVLMRIVRGAGTRGLSGIYPQRNLLQKNEVQLSVDSSQFTVIRPLLGTKRSELEAYLREIGQNWREDSSNRDLRHARNRVRHGIVPRLERELNPRVRETLAETAEIARSEEEYWQAEVGRILPEVWNGGLKKLKPMGGLALALRRRVIRAAAESVGLRLEFKHVEEMLELPAPSSTMLPQGWVVLKQKDGCWQFEAGGRAETISGYAYALAVPGVVQVAESGTCFEILIVPGDAMPGYNPDHVFDPTLLRQELTVRNWRPGDRFWPGHSKSSKKVKTLLQERKLAAKERKLWPVVVSGSEIVWVRGFPAPARLRPREGAKQALVIQEYAKV